MSLPYRIYKALYPFSARDASELTMSPEDTLVVYMNPDGQWPDDQRWMRGYNQLTGLQGDFPGPYTHFVEECTPGSPEPPPPEPEPKEISPPPPPARRARASFQDNSPTQPPVPNPRPRRQRPSQALVEQEDPEPPAPVHDLFKVSLHLPVLCSVCEDYIWGARNTGHKCNLCGAVSHTSCREALMNAIKCDPSRGSGLEDSGRDYAYTVPSYMEFREADVETWMKALNIEFYWENFKRGGLTSGTALASVTMETLVELGITDEMHQQVLMECLNELCRPSSSPFGSSMSTDDTDVGRKKRPPSMISIQSMVTSRDSKKRDRMLNGHVFKMHSFAALSKCDYCNKYLWGLMRQGLQCKSCDMSVHKMCLMDTLLSCDQWRARANKSEAFGVELASQFNCQVDRAPPVVMRCIEIVERKGLKLEGLYRISPSLGEIQKLKEELNRDVSAVSLSDPRWTDAHVFAGALKLYLRELPEPVFTYELYAEFVKAGRGSKDMEVQFNMLWPLVERLPPHNRTTLEVILTHLVKVVSNQQLNRMSYNNLALVFGPTLVRPKPDNIIELVSNTDAHCRIVDVLLQKGPWNQPAAPPVPPRVPSRSAPTVPPPSEQRHSIAAIPSFAPPSARPAPPIPASTTAMDDTDSFPMTEPETLTDCGWYWGSLSREDVTLKLKDTPDGTFLVRDSQRGQAEYTLTVRKGGQNKLIRIMYMNGKYGFADPGQFNSVPELINYFRYNPLTKYNARLNIKLDHPVSRFARIECGDEDEDGQEDLDNDVEELLDKLREVTESFNEKNDHYLKLEVDFEDMRKELDRAQASFNACNNVVDMLGEQMELLKKWGENSSYKLQDAERRKVMDTIKALQDKHVEAVRSRHAANMDQRKMNNRFRSLDRELNTIRPEMMRLQWQRDQYNSKLLQEGFTQHEISMKVQERAATESESIYGTLYGTLEDADDDESQGVYEDPNNPIRPPIPTPEPTYEPSSMFAASVGPVPPPRNPLSRQRSPAPAPPRGPEPGMMMSMPLPAAPVPIGPRRGRVQVNSSIEERPHNRQDTWYIECDRAEAQSRLRGKQNGTFLCRPSGRAQQTSKGGLHTHTIDIVYDGIKHLKVVQDGSKYGFSVPCQYQSLLDLVLCYSDISLETHNPKLTTTLAYPINTT